VNYQLKNLCFTVALLIYIADFSVRAQVLGGSGGSVGSASANFKSSDFYGMTLKEKKVESVVEGNPYIEDHWNTGTMVLNGGLEIKAYPLKYDLQNNRMEIKTQKQIKLCPLERIDRFTWTNDSTEVIHTFVNDKDHHLAGGTPLTGLYEILFDGSNAQLLMKTELNFRAPDYNEALDVGSRNKRIVRFERYFLAKGKAIYEFKKSKKKNFLLFGDKAQKIKSFMNKNKLKFNQRTDLMAVVRFFDTID